MVPGEPLNSKPNKSDLPIKTEKARTLEAYAGSSLGVVEERVFLFSKWLNTCVMSLLGSDSECTGASFAAKG